MRVLYVSHTAQVSGAERSLLTLLEHLPTAVEPVLASPPGPLAEAARALGVPVVGAPGTEGSLKLHPLHTPRAVAALGRAALRIRRLAARPRADLVHANAVRSGISASLAASLAGPPAVVHLRDCLPPSRLTAATMRLVASGATALIANSRYTRECLGDAPRPPVTRVVHNPVDLRRFDPARTDRAAARDRFGLDADDVVLCVVGQITPWKGQDDAVEVAARLAARNPRVRLLLAGSAKFASGATRHDNRAFLAGLEARVERDGLEQVVRFMGERDDVPDVLAATDLLLMPSWEEPFGRALVEAMAMGVPVAATEVGGPPEIVRQGVDGLLLPPRCPEAWAAALAPLAGDRARLRAMGAAGRERALEFGPAAHVEGVLDAYAAALRAARGRPDGSRPRAGAPSPAAPGRPSA